MKQLTPTILAAAITLSLGACSTHPENQQEQVEQTIINMVNAIDSKDWQTAQAQFSDNVFVDYASLTGQPGAEVSAGNLVGGWQGLLQNVSTHHMLSNFEVEVKGDKAESYSHVYASHIGENINYWDAYGRYYHQLERQQDQWRITNMTLLMHGQKGNTSFIQETIEMNQQLSDTTNTQPTVSKVQFDSEGQTLVGNLYLPSNFDPKQRYSAVVVSGSWTTVKEQMSGLYAEKLAEQGLIALAFDFSNFGESEGAVHFYENPTQKVKDIKNAVTFLQSLPEVDNQQIGALGICAGSMYTLMAAAEDDRIQSVVTAASWLHDAEAVSLFYGGEEGVKEKIAAAQKAKADYAETGEVAYIPSISTTDPSAAMYGPYDYYLNPERGAVVQWQADKFAVASWEDWLTLDPMPTASKLKTPTLMIHSDGAVLPDYTKRYFANIAAEDKKLHWMETEMDSPYHQFNFYDQEQEVNEAIEQAVIWFEKM